MNKGIRDIEQLLNQKYGTDISVYDDLYLNKILNNRISVLKAGKLSAYCSILEESENEASILIDSINNVYSEFFRNQLTFNFIEQFLITVLIRKGIEGSGEIRIWSAGCSSGQEAYSLAIIANNCIRNIHTGLKPRVFGTDKSEREIEVAKKGVYNKGYMKNCTLDFIDKYFTKTGELYSVNSSVREIVNFSAFDLINSSYASPPDSIYGSFDIIMCSNLLFYYKENVRKKIITRLMKSLPRDRFLVTGEAEINIFESLSGLKRYSPFVPVFVKTN